jgi:hypothetical protein
MLDIHYEGDLWKAFPPAPAVIKFIVLNIVWFFGSSTYKFGACDRHGNMKPLYAVPDSKDD